MTFCTVTGSQLSRILSVTPKQGMKAGFPLCLKRKNPAVLTAGLNISCWPKRLNGFPALELMLAENSADLNTFFL